MDKYSYVANAHGHYLDELFKAYRENPESIDESWKKFFEGFEFAQENYGAMPTNGQAIATPKETSVKNLIYN